MAEEVQPKFSLVKLIPLTVFVAVLSQISVLSYYNNFNFSPITYFDSHEIIIASVKEFATIAFIFFLHSVFYIAFYLPIFDKKPSQTSSLNEYKKTKKSFIIWIRIQLLISVIAFLVFWALSVHDYINWINDWLGSLLIWTSISSFIAAGNLKYVLLIRLRNYRASQTQKLYPYIDTIYFMSILLIALLIVNLARFKHEYILNNNPYKGTELTIDEGVIKCTSEVIFIGKSQKYYFIYNTPDSSIRVVKRDDIKKEVIKIDPNVNFFYRF